MAPEVPLQHVMVVDDEPMIRQFVTSALLNSGYQVSDAGSAGQAMRMLEANPDFDLLVTDIVMPDGNGCDLAEQMRRKKPDLRVLFISGYDAPGVRQIQRGEFLQKPFRIPEFLERVRLILQ